LLLLSWWVILRRTLIVSVSCINLLLLLKRVWRLLNRLIRSIIRLLLINLYVDRFVVKINIFARDFKLSLIYWLSFYWLGRCWSSSVLLSGLLKWTDMLVDISLMLSATHKLGLGSRCGFTILSWWSLESITRRAHCTRNKSGSLIVSLHLAVLVQNSLKCIWSDPFPRSPLLFYRAHTRWGRWWGKVQLLLLVIIQSYLLLSAMAPFSAHLSCSSVDFFLNFETPRHLWLDMVVSLGRASHKLQVVSSISNVVNGLLNYDGSLILLDLASVVIARSPHCVNLCIILVLGLRFHFCSLVHI